MKTQVLISTIFFYLLTLGHSAYAQKSSVLIELFTSQGCSSCPPADEVLQSLSDSGNGVIALSYHVDYWNRLGWKDPYSKEEFSQRQRWYAGKLDGKIYTPELVINGRQGIVGSRAADAKALVQDALSLAPQLRLTAGYQLAEASTTLAYSLEGELKNLMVAGIIMQKNAVNEIPRGENSGKKLNHVNVVRTFAEATALSSGELTLEIPEDLMDDNFGIVLFVQDRATGEILAAKSLK